MQTTIVLAGLAAVAYGQGVTSIIPPPTPAPAGFSPSIAGTFEITAVNSTVAKRSLEKRECGAEGSLTLTLNNGILKDAKGRTGYIADNYQFQFDGPPQTGAIYTAGFSISTNHSLALGGSAIFYECLSGTFYNLYDRSWAPQCEPILIVALPCGASTTAPAAIVSQGTDGKVTGTTVGSAPVTQIGDGQVQAPSAIPISEIKDGQPQVPTGLISQISDGQIQKPTGAPISQIPDGQIQQPTGSAPAITQIPDGQVQAPTSVAAAPTNKPISQIPDGQIQAPNGTAAAPSSTPTQVLSGASLLVSSSMAAALAGLAAVLLL